MKKHKLKLILTSTLFALFSFFGLSSAAFAEDNIVMQDSITMSPLNQKIILTPGETYRGSFNISSRASNKVDLKYKITIEPFYVDDNYDILYDNNGDFNQIVDWTTVDTDSGTLSPNTQKEVYFSVKVPEGAPAGGQYVAIKVTSDNETENLEGGANINVKYGIAHIVYAEVAGTTERKGEIANLSMPSFMFSGKIAGTSSVKNTGNVHSDATYKLTVTPLFSNEEIYSNEEKPETKTILPDRTLSNTTSWEETPSMGIFNVVYTVEFEGVTKEVKKMVIICPIWLLIIIIAIILLIIFSLLAKSKKKK